MSGRAGAQARGRRGQRRRVQNRKSWARIFLGKYFEFESRAGIAEAGDTLVAFERIVGEAQLEIFEEAEFQETVHVLVSGGGFKSVFNFQHAALHCFPCGCECGPVRDGHEFVLRRLARLCAERRGLCETREQEEGEGARSSGEYSQFVSPGEANTCGRYIRVSLRPLRHRCSCIMRPQAILKFINYSESSDETMLNLFACQPHPGHRLRQSQHP